jgi:PAS domain S-box-containing protein
MTRAVGAARRADGVAAIGKDLIAILEDSHNAVIGVNALGRITYVNPALERTFGYSSEELLDQPVELLLPELLDDRHLADRNGFVDAPVGGPNGVGRDVARRKDGTELPVEVGLSSVRRNGSLVLFATVADITAGRTVEAELAARREQLEELVRSGTRELQDEVAAHGMTVERLHLLAAQLERSNRELREFALVVSHDLQAPLRRVQVFAERADRLVGTRAEAEVSDYLRRIRSTAASLQGLVRDLFSYTKVESLDLETREVDLDGLLASVMDELEEEIAGSGGRVLVASLPAVEGDEEQLRQLFLNLIGNGLKFRRPGVPVLVGVNAVAAAEGAPFVTVTVTDNGTGFDNAHAKRIFRIFERVHDPAEYPGTGIGLAICRRIVERHGGAIRASGDPGKGSTFTVELPPPANRGAIR